MLRTLSHRNEHAAVVEHRCSDDRAAREHSGPRRPRRVFWVAVKPPDFATRRRVVRAQPTISSAEEHLYAAIDIRPDGTGPLAVQHMFARPNGAPDNFARTFVHCDQTGRMR